MSTPLGRGGWFSRMPLLRSNSDPVQGLPRVETGSFPATSVLYPSRTVGQLLLSERPWKKLTKTSGQLFRQLRCLLGKQKEGMHHLSFRAQNRVGARGGVTTLWALGSSLFVSRTPEDLGRLSGWAAAQWEERCHFPCPPAGVLQP